MSIGVVPFLSSSASIGVSHICGSPTVSDGRAQSSRTRTARIPNGAKSQTARNPKRREIPDGAKSRTARNPRQRETTRNSQRRENAHGDDSRQRQICTPPVGSMRSLSVFGISRRLGFRAVWDFAPFGISRRLGFRALSPLRRLAFRAFGFGAVSQLRRLGFPFTTFALGQPLCIL